MTDVTVTIHSLFTLTSRRTIRANQRFTFNVTATNSSGSDAKRLENVRYHISLADPAVARLTVPATNPDKDGTVYKGKDSASGDFVDLAPNAEVQEMYLFPRSTVRGGGPVVIERAGDLDVGDSDLLKIHGRAGVDAGGSSTQISCQVTAEPDVEIPTSTKLLEIAEA